MTAKPYELLLFDVDGVLLDFDASERESIAALLSDYGVPVTEEAVRAYHVLNKRYWQRLERGELTRAQTLALRFEEFFAGFGIRVDGAEADGRYRLHLNASAIRMDGMWELLADLRERYALYIITNGGAETQRERLKKSGLDRYFSGIFISEEAGAEKPSPDFFAYCFRQMGRRDREHMLIIGDSLTSDIRGGNLAGIDTVWFCRETGEEAAGTAAAGSRRAAGAGDSAPGIRPTYRAASVRELRDLLLL